MVKPTHALIVIYVPAYRQKYADMDIGQMGLGRVLPSHYEAYITAPVNFNFKTDSPQTSGPADYGLKLLKLQPIFLKSQITATAWDLNPNNRGNFSSSWL